MIINIFGVGRSGTTGLQLYLSYLLAKKEGKVRINSEPYIWETRKGPLSLYGQKIFLDSGQIQEESEGISKRHEKYLRSLVENSPSVVTKFIRGNGLINQVNQFTSPDLTFVIYRDIRQVLRSLKKYNWEFTDIYNKYLKNELRTYWASFEKNNYTQKVIKSLNLDIELIRSKQELRNALYWYTNNLKALEFQKENTYHILYSDIESVHGILKNYAVGEVLPIKNSLFFGDHLNKEFPLTDVKKVSRVTQKIKNEIDHFSFFLERKLSFPAFYLQRQCGSIVKLQKEAVLSKEEHRPTSNPIQHESDFHPITNFLRENLLERLDGVSASK